MSTRARRTRRNTHGAALLLAVLAGAGCRGRTEAPARAPADAALPPAPGPRFEDVAAKAGIGFRYTFGDLTYDNILESSGSGVAVFDYDGDGKMDILFLNGRYLDGISDPAGRTFANARNALYRNNGDGTFTDVTEKAGVGGSHWAMAATIADLDGDGLEDIFLSNYGPNTFLHNNGDGTYSDFTERAGLAGPATLNGFVKWSVGAAAFDADGDGKLELLVANFLAFDPAYKSPGSPDRMPAPAEYRGQASILYKRGPDGRWADVTEKAGLHFPDSKAMGLTVWDCDGDGRLDVFQANDHQPNFLFRNIGRGVFEDIAAAAGVAVNLDGVGTGHMHASLGDVDGDGLLDVFVTDLSYQSLYRAIGPGRFEDVTEKSGVRRLMDGAESWGGGLYDLDNDGAVDIFAANGGADTLVLKKPTLLMNDGAGHFRDASAGAGDYFEGKRSGRGVAFGDFDDDGRIDIVVSHVDLKGTPALLKNVTANGNHWLGVALKPTRSPSEPAGALVKATAGGKTQVRVYQRAQSYLSQNDPRLHFGLGKAAKVDTLEIRWPGGAVQTLRDVPADRYVTVTEPRSPE
ncbi:MAG TPA: CRTAC1 family protein [Thermoanaerobaculia bacterium]|nr:CRTAC1 family protein [Thermoanaerobaculia bacterium]